jgi:hypothetical protein
MVDDALPLPTDFWDVKAHSQQDPGLFLGFGLLNTKAGNHNDGWDSCHSSGLSSLTGLLGPNC